MSETASNVIRFGDCEFDPNRRELHQNGALVALEPKVFALLLYLIEQRHRAVDKDEIQDAVWTGTVVSETALTRAIMKARRAVGDSADTQAVIRTVHGHGYQFVATLLDDEAGLASPEKPPAATRPRLLAAAIAITLLGFIVYLWPDEPGTEAVHLAIMPVDNQTGDSEYDWTRLGLMGFANELIQQSETLSIVRSSDAIRFAESHGLPDDDSAAADLEILQDVYGANRLLRTKLEQNAGTLRLSYALDTIDGPMERGTMVGPEPTALIRGMIHVINNKLDKRATPNSEITVIAEDTFINEAYSRGLAFSLQGRCTDALQLFEVVKSATGEITRAHYEWADCARILGRWQEAEAAFMEILAGLPVEPATPLRALAHLGLGTTYIRTGRGDAARETLRNGLQIARQARDYTTQGMILNNLAINAKDRREFDEARALLARATVAYTEVNRGILPGQLPAALANIDMAEGKLEQAEQHLQQALAAFRATGDRRNEAMMLNNFGYLRRIQGRIDEAEPLHLESLAIRREIGDRVGQGRILGMLSILYKNEGRLDDAKRTATEAYEIASDANDRLFMATSLSQLADAEYSAGELAASRDNYRQAKTLFEGIADISRAAQVTLRLANIDRRNGDTAAALSGIDAVLAAAQREALHEPAIEAMEMRGDIAHEQGDNKRSIHAYNNALQNINDTGFIIAKNRITAKLVNRLLDEQDLAAAEPLIGTLIEAGDSASTLEIRARYAALQGNSARAAELRAELQEAYGQDTAGQETVTAGPR